MLIEELQHSANVENERSYGERPSATVARSKWPDEQAREEGYTVKTSIRTHAPDLLQYLFYSLCFCPTRILRHEAIE